MVCKVCGHASTSHNGQAVTESDTARQVTMNLPHGYCEECRASKRPIETICPAFEP